MKERGETLKKSGFSEIAKGNKNNFAKSTAMYENTAILARSENQKRQIKLLKVVQAKKSIWRMPWHWEPTKDVTSCDKPR